MRLSYLETTFQGRKVGMQKYRPVPWKHAISMRIAQHWQLDPAGDAPGPVFSLAWNHPPNWVYIQRTHAPCVGIQRAADGAKL